MCFHYLKLTYVNLIRDPFYIYKKTKNNRSIKEKLVMMTHNLMIDVNFDQISN
jgi:hypothetical protein